MSGAVDLLSRAISPAEAVEVSIYFLVNFDAGVVKIGYATDLDARLASLQTGNHVELDLLYSFTGTKGCELVLHDALADERIRGEWFRYIEMIDAVINAIEDFRDEKAGPLWPDEVSLSADEVSRCVADVLITPILECEPIIFHGCGE